MSVRVRLNDRNFFQSPTVIGARLYEGEAQAQQQPANAVQQPTQLQGPTLDLEVNKIIADAFSQLVTNISQQLQGLKLPEGVQVQWVKAELPKDQTLPSVWAVVQPFLVNNIKAVADALLAKQGEPQQQQQPQQLQQPTAAPAPQQETTQPAQ